MKKLVLLFLLFILYILGTNANANDLFGRYISEPLFDESKYKGEMLDKVRKANENNKMIIIINKNKMIVEIKGMKLDRMDYSIHGDFVVGLDVTKDEKSFWPFFIDSDNSIYAMGRRYKKITLKRKK